MSPDEAFLKALETSGSSAQILVQPAEVGLDLKKLRAGKFFQDTLETELVRQLARKEAHNTLDRMALEGSYKALEHEHRMIYDPLPAEAPELIPGILPVSGNSAIVGMTNTGKSLLALEICSSLLSGQPLWGAIQPNKTLKRIVYILGEHTCETIQGLYHRTQLPKEGDFRLIGPEHLHPYKALVIGGVAQQTAIDRLVKWTAGAELIVFDPLAGFIQGLGAEQDNAAMRTLIDSIGYIATANGAACLILSHMGKPRMDDQGNESIRTSYAMRGASAQEDALTHVFYLTKQLSIKERQSTELFNLISRKVKGVETSKVYTLERDPTTVRNTLIGDRKTRAYPTVADKMALVGKISNLRAAKPNYNEDTLLECVAATEGLTPTTIRRWLKNLMADGLED
jgi:hypothetical protein